MSGTSIIYVDPSGVRHNVTMERQVRRLMEDLGKTNAAMLALYRSVALGMQSLDAFNVARAASFLQWQRALARIIEEQRDR